MKRILIIEDDQLTAKIYRNKFYAEGFEVACATDGESGFELIHSFQPDVVVLDLMLPKLTGLELLEKIRSQPGSARLPVIVFSNSYLSNLVRQAWEAGATKCLSKANCEPKQLINVVRSLFPQAAPIPVVTGQSSAPAKTPAAGAGPDDSETLKELRHKLGITLSETFASARAAFAALAGSTGETTPAARLYDLYGRVHALTGNAGAGGMFQIGQLAGALEALLKELHDRPASLNASAVRTLSVALDLLGMLVEQCLLSAAQSGAATFDDGILVIDGGADSRSAVMFALETAGLRATSVETTESALQRLAERKFDLVILDTDTPGPGGLEFYSRLRALAQNGATPVLFVTPLIGFGNLLSSLPDTGNDLIAKPFLTMELAVKALAQAIRSRLPLLQSGPRDPVIPAPA